MTLIFSSLATVLYIISIGACIYYWPTYSLLALGVLVVTRFSWLYCTSSPHPECEFRSRRNLLVEAYYVDHNLQADIRQAESNLASALQDQELASTLADKIGPDCLSIIEKRVARATTELESARARRCLHQPATETARKRFEAAHDQMLAFLNAGKCLELFRLHSRIYA